MHGSAWGKCVREKVYVGSEPKVASSVPMLVLSLVHCDKNLVLLEFPSRKKAAPCTQ